MVSMGNHLLTSVDIFLLLRSSAVPNSLLRCGRHSAEVNEYDTRMRSFWHDAH